MNYKVIKVNTLSEKEKRIIEIIILNNFNKNKAFDILYPDKVHWSNVKKSNYFRYLLEGKKDATQEFIDNYYKDTFKNLFLSKEKILTELVEVIQECRQRKEYKNVLSGYKQLTDLMGLNIIKGSIDINQTSLVLHYHSPEESPSEPLKIDSKTITIENNED